MISRPAEAYLEKAILVIEERHGPWRLHSAHVLVHKQCPTIKLIFSSIMIFAFVKAKSEFYVGQLNLVRLITSIQGHFVKVSCSTLTKPATWLLLYVKVFYYIQKHLRFCIVYDTLTHDWSGYDWSSKKDWSQFYPDIIEPVPANKHI